MLAKKAMELKSTGEASWEYARSCIAQNKTKEAKAALEKVVETDKSNIVANRELGSIFYGEKNYEKALPLMKLAYHAKPDGETAYKIAQIFTTQKSPDSAIVYYKEALKDKKLEKPEAGLNWSALFSGRKHKQAARSMKRSIKARQPMILRPCVLCRKSGKGQE